MHAHESGDRKGCPARGNRGTGFTDGRTGFTDGRADGWTDGFIDVMKFYSMSDRMQGSKPIHFSMSRDVFKCHLLIIEYLSVHLFDNRVVT